MNDLTPEQIAARKQWTDALRSGEYKQARQEIRSGDSYCCLGVACDFDGPWVGDTHPAAEDGELLPELLEKLGMTRRNQSKAIELNDDLEKSFDEIADWIDAGMPGDWE